MKLVPCELCGDEGGWFKVPVIMGEDFTAVSPSELSALWARCANPFCGVPKPETPEEWRAWSESTKVPRT